MVSRLQSIKDMAEDHDANKGKHKNISFSFKNEKHKMKFSLSALDEKDGASLLDSLDKRQRAEVWPNPKVQALFSGRFVPKDNLSKSDPKLDQEFFNNAANFEAGIPREVFEELTPNFRRELVATMKSMFLCTLNQSMIEDGERTTMSPSFTVE